MRDSLFNILYSCVDGLKSTRLVHTLYLLQLSGVDCDLRYKITTSSLDSKGVDDYVDYLIGLGLIDIDNGIIRLTAEGYSYIDHSLFTQDEWDTVEYIQTLIKDLSDEELHFLCLVDMIVFDAYNSCSPEQLLEDKDRIKHTLAILSDEFSEDNFNIALGILRNLRKGLIDCDK